MRELLKFGKGATRRVLTGKTGLCGYYKGKGWSAAGFNTQDAKYLVDRNRIHQFVVPDLTGFPLKPYVDSTCLPDDMNDEDFPRGRLSGEMFLQLATKLGAKFNPSIAEPSNWLISPPPEVLEQIESSKTVTNPHHKARPPVPPKKYQKIPNREFIPYRWHN